MKCKNRQNCPYYDETSCCCNEDQFREDGSSYCGQYEKKYLKDEIKFSYHRSLFAIKPILKKSELDDSRPTIIKKFSTNPTFISVLSGKINTIFDLDKLLL